MKNAERVSLQNPRLDWMILSIFILIHALAIWGLITYFSWYLLIIALFLYWLFSGIGVGLCFHRLLSHRSFQLPKWLEYLLATVGTLSQQGSPIFWVGNHRMHHAYCDTDRDPYNARRGFWWSHVLWALHRQDSIHFDYKVYSKYVADLSDDTFYRFLHRYDVGLQGLLVGIFFVLGGLPLVFYGTVIRIVIGWHLTWLVNSACHAWGDRPFEIIDSATNLWWVALLTFGEGWHHSHHANPKLARFGLRWWSVDLNYISIWVLKKLGLATRVYEP